MYKIIYIYNCNNHVHYSVTSFYKCSRDVKFTTFAFFHSCASRRHNWEMNCGGA